MLEYLLLYSGLWWKVNALVRLIIILKFSTIASLLLSVKIYFFFYNVWKKMLFAQAYFNSLWASGAIWQHKFGSALPQIMAWCLTAAKPLPKSMLTSTEHAETVWQILFSIMSFKIILLKLPVLVLPHRPVANELTTQEAKKKKKKKAFINSLTPWKCVWSLKSIIFKLMSRINILSISCDIMIKWMP